MLVRLEHREWLIIGRGLAILASCIVIGSIVVEIQLNQLTYWQDVVQVFNIRRVAKGAYLAYVLGAEYYLQAAWQIGAISCSSHSLHLSILGLCLNLPTKWEFDPTPVTSYTKVTWRQIIDFSFQLKHTVNQLMLDVQPLWQESMQSIKDIIR